MSNAKLSLKYEVYVAAPVRNVWETLTDGSATKQYFYGCSVRSTFKKGAPISYLGDVNSICSMANTGIPSNVFPRRPMPKLLRSPSPALRRRADPCTAGRT